MTDYRTTRAIVHFDGDSFFASVEQSLNYRLKGKPVVTGAERGAATSASYEAKQLGIGRSMTLKQIKEICPSVIVVNSDYRAYAIYAHRMYRIVRRFTPLVEEYSVDECFADITGLDKAYGMSYEAIVLMIKEKLETSLGITFGVGLASTKVLAKAASKYNKPAGFTRITTETKDFFLQKMSVGSVWGIGGATALSLNKLNVFSALEFANKNKEWFDTHNLAKPLRSLWYELNGISVKSLSISPVHDDIGSIISSRTFSPPSTDKTFIYSQLAKNIERACEKARNHHVRARAISFHLKTQSFLYGRIELDLAVATADPRDILAAVKVQFDKLYHPHVEYRATGISLRSLVPDHVATNDLFGEGERVTANSPVLKSVDFLNRRYGSATVFLGTSLQATKYRERNRVAKAGRRDAEVLLPSQYKKKSIDIPFLGKVR